MNTEKIQLLEQYLNNSNKISIIVHQRPDGDAMGSAIGFYYLLKTLNKSSVILLNDRYPNSLKFFIDEELDQDILDYENQNEQIDEHLKTSDLILCLDHSRPSRTGELEQGIINSGATKIVIDHHLYPQTEYYDLIFSRCDISSTCEFLYQIFLDFKNIEKKAENLPAKTAYALFVGMTTDTNNFANSVYDSTLEMASSLLAVGVNRNEIIESLYQCYREERLRLMSYLLGSMKITEDGVAYMILDRETALKYNLQDGETEGFVNIPLSIKEVRLSIFIKEDINKFRASLRSKAGTSANKCAGLYFNGGGHEQAAGGSLTLGKDVKNISELEDYIIKVTKKFFNEEENN